MRRSPMPPLSEAEEEIGHVYSRLLTYRKLKQRGDEQDSLGTRQDNLSEENSPGHLDEEEEPADTRRFLTCGPFHPDGSLQPIASKSNSLPRPSE